MCGGEEGERGRISRTKDPELEGTRRDGYMLTAELSFVDIRSARALYSDLRCSSEREEIRNTMSKTRRWRRRRRGR
jgi:hypothetical protein